MKITILTDRKSWIIPYAERLGHELDKLGHDIALAYDSEEISKGDCLFILGYLRILSSDVLKRNSRNVVIHESALPKGRGFAPLFWQILEGKNDITVSLIEAAEEADAGVIYLQENLQFEGYELHDELRHAQGEITIALALRFIQEWPETSRLQQGEPTTYKRRTPQDSELDPSKSLLELFQQLRIANNDHYPAFFHHPKFPGKKFFLRVTREDDPQSK